jgi:hypothetical protein
MSPSSRLPSGYCFSTTAIIPIIEERWMGIEFSACATSLPRRSISAVEWSRRSLMLVE